MGRQVFDGYWADIGIECHVQFNTKTKLFAAVANDARSAEPNTLTSPLCFGLPGTLPVLNEAVVQRGIRAGLALQAKVANYMTFDRKHYFYPDLPLGYQITQLFHPIITDGMVKAPMGDGSTKQVGIVRAHLEADAGKSIHPKGADYSLVDLNRAGTPLLEIVSAPDITTPAEARAYAQELYYLMKFAEVSDVDLYQGNMRFDVNVSVREAKDGTELGTRTETKNLNSFRSVERAAAFEIQRQVELLKKGGEVVQETRGFNESTGKTKSQRGKEEAHDYRYFPEPDLPPIRISQRQIDDVAKDMPPGPAALRLQLSKLDVDQRQVDVLFAHQPLLRLALETLPVLKPKARRRVMGWVSGEAITLIDSEAFNWSQWMLTKDGVLALSAMVDDAKLSSSGAKAVFARLAFESSQDPETVAKELRVLQVSDTSAIEQLVDDVIAKNPAAAKDVEAGELKAVGFLVGQVMAASRGQANPQMAQQIIKERLGL